MKDNARSFIFLALVLPALTLFVSCHGGPGSAAGPLSGPAIRSAPEKPEGPAEAQDAPLAPGRFDTLIVADFKDEAPWPDLDAGRETAVYLAHELVSWFEGPVRHGEAGADRERAGRGVVLTGSVTLSRQLRKALRPGLPVAGPFRTGRSELLEKAVYTLVLSVVATSAEGVVFERTFEISRTYEDFEKEPDFALYELLDRVRSGLFPVLFGRPGRSP